MIIHIPHGMILIRLAVVGVLFVLLMSGFRAFR
jgi:uncharacterized integral membrane protein